MATFIWMFGLYWQSMHIVASNTHWLYIWVAWVSYKRQILIIIRKHLISPRFLVGSVLFIVLDFVLSYYVSTFWVPCCDVRYDFRIKTYSVRPTLQLFVRGLVSYLHYLCLFAYNGVQHILCCVFVLFVFVLCLVYSILSAYLDCPFLIVPSIFSAFEWKPPICRK